MATQIKVIMFTDCVGSSTNKSRIGDSPCIQLLRTLEQITLDVAAENGGQIIKSLGDGHLLTFDSAVRAIRAGLELQKRVFDYTTNHKLQCPLLLRVGIDVGDVDVDADGDVLGHYVDMAKRVEAAGDGIKVPVLFTHRVFALLPPKAVECRLITEEKLKGSGSPIALYQATGVVNPCARPRQKLCAFLTGAFFQVLVRSFSLKRDSTGGLCLRINAEKDLEVITDSGQKDEFFREIAQHSSAKDNLISELKEFMKGGVARTFDCDKWPLRYANGGALPIVKLEGARYVCLFYRDIFPIGWNIANGASDSYAELYFPDRIIKREFGEEFVTADHHGEVMRFYAPGVENISPGYQTAIVAALDKEFEGLYSKYRRQKLSVNFLPMGPDRVTVSVDRDSRDTENLFLSIIPEDNAIEVDRIACVTLDSNQSIIDGEVANGVPMGRVAGLFRLENLGSRLRGKKFKPDLFFAEGARGEQGKFEDIVQTSVRKIQQHRTLDQREAYQSCKNQYDLCPITRALLERIAAALKRGSVAFPD